MFHHAQGLTEGIGAFAGRLRQAGHIVHTPDLFDGGTFDSIDAGMAYAEELGFPDEILRRGAHAVEDLPAALVYLGFSLGVLPARRLAQTRPGARGALLCYSCVPTSFFGPWPDGVPVQVHGMDAERSSTRATSTTSRTVHCPPTTPPRRRSSPNADCVRNPSEWVWLSGSWMS